MTGNRGNSSEKGIQLFIAIFMEKEKKMPEFIVLKEE
jgi:hypothetical protein